MQPMDRRQTFQIRRRPMNFQHWIISKFQKNPPLLTRTGSRQGDIRGSSDVNESDLVSDSGSISDCSSTSMDLTAQKGTSFKFPAKRHSSKPRNVETMKYQTGISNRFDCLKYDTAVHTATLDESVRRPPPPSPSLPPRSFLPQIVQAYGKLAFEQ